MYPGDKNYHRRNLIVDRDLVLRAMDWHGGQGSMVYSFASTGLEDYVSPSMIDAAVAELEADLVSNKKAPKDRRLNRKEVRELKDLIGELDAVARFSSEHTTKEAGVGDVDSGYATWLMEEDNPKITIHRKGYTTKRGTYVKPTRFKIEDPGRPGVRSFGAKSATGKYAARRKMKPLITHEGSLGGPGYTKRSVAARHRLLSKCVTEWGYRSCLGKIQVQLLSTALKPATRRVWAADKKWLMSKYGGPGSFGPRGGKQSKKSTKRSGKSRRKNPSMGQIMRDAMK